MTLEESFREQTRPHAFPFATSIPMYKDSLLSIGIALRSGRCFARVAIGAAFFSGTTQMLVGWIGQDLWRCHSHRQTRSSFRASQMYQGFSTPPPLRSKEFVSTLVIRGLQVLFLGGRLLSCLSIRILSQRQSLCNLNGSVGGAEPHQEATHSPPLCRRLSPPGRSVMNGWRRDERTRDTPQSHPAYARLVCQAYHRHPGSTATHTTPGASTRSLRMPAEQNSAVVD